MGRRVGRRAAAERSLAHAFVLLAASAGAGAICCLLLLALLFTVAALGAPRWILLIIRILLWPAAILPGLWTCIYLWPDRLPYAVTRGERKLPMWVRLVSDTRLVATATLVGTALLALFWTDVSHDLLLLPVLAGGCLLWLLALPWMIIERRASRLGRLLRIVVLFGAVALLYYSPAVGERFRLWLSELRYREEARIALAAPALGTAEFPPSRPFLVDRSDDPPVRVVFFWYLSRDGWDGVVYDPSGEVSRVEWIQLGNQPTRIRARHLWGPWYRAFGT